MRKVLYRSIKSYGEFGPIYADFDKKGYFHQFTKSNDETCGIIEKEDGEIELIGILCFKFVDRPDESINEEVSRLRTENYNLRVALKHKDCEYDDLNSEHRSLNIKR